MLQSVRKLVSIPDIPITALLSSGILVSFFWLLLHNHIHPIVIYFLQLYLAF